MENSGPPQVDMNVLIELDAAGGHCEALSRTHGLALSALMQARLVQRVTYPAGLVIYEITDAGRRMSAGFRETAQYQRPPQIKAPNRPTGTWLPGTGPTGTRWNAMASSGRPPIIFSIAGTAIPV